MSPIHVVAVRDELAERNVTPLPQLAKEVEGLAARVGEQLKRMGAVWK